MTIQILGRTDKIQQALDFFEMMKKQGIKPNERTYSIQIVSVFFRDDGGGRGRQGERLWYLTEIIYPHEDILQERAVSGGIRNTGNHEGRAHTPQRDHVCCLYHSFALF